MLSPTESPRADPATKTVAGLRCEWRRISRVLADPAVELDSETVTPLLTCHSRLLAAGVKIDPMADALVRQLAFQLADVEAFADG